LVIFLATLVESTTAGFLRLTQVSAGIKVQTPSKGLLRAIKEAWVQKFPSTCCRFEFAVRQGEFGQKPKPQPVLKKSPVLKNYETPATGTAQNIMESRDIISRSALFRLLMNELAIGRGLQFNRGFAMLTPAFFSFPSLIKNNPHIRTKTTPYFINPPDVYPLMYFAKLP